MHLLYLLWTCYTYNMNQVCWNVKFQNVSIVLSNFRHLSLTVTLYEISNFVYIFLGHFRQIKVKYWKYANLSKFINYAHIIIQKPSNPVWKLYFRFHNKPKASCQFVTDTIRGRNEKDNIILYTNTYIRVSLTKNQ